MSKLEEAIERSVVPTLVELVVVGVSLAGGIIVAVLFAAFVVRSILQTFFSFLL